MPRLRRNSCATAPNMRQRQELDIDMADSEPFDNNFQAAAAPPVKPRARWWPKLPLQINAAFYATLVFLIYKCVHAHYVRLHTCEGTLSLARATPQPTGGDILGIVDSVVDAGKNMLERLLNTGFNNVCSIAQQAEKRASMYLLYWLITWVVLVFTRNMPDHERIAVIAFVTAGTWALHDGAYGMPTVFTNLWG